MTTTETTGSGGRQPAPGRLRLVQLFVNTRDVEEGLDEIGDAPGLARWLSDHQLLDDGAKVTAADVERAQAVREALRSMLLANGEGREPDRVATEVLNGAATRAELLPRFAAGGAALAPSRSGVDGALGVLLAVVIEAMAGGTWARLKACREETCQWAYYDASKNRSGAWCSMAVCGNRNKGRAFRRRSRSQARS